jgi:hypothetical protein
MDETEMLSRVKELWLDLNEIGKKSQRSLASG